MINHKDVRIGNLVMYDNRIFKIHTIAEEFPTLDTSEFGIGVVGWDDLEPVILTEERLVKFGFIGIDNESYINGKRWVMQVSDDYTDESLQINRDGTWFDGIGSYSYAKDGKMAVCVLCRGNYICNNVSPAHELQNLYFALTGMELTINK